MARSLIQALKARADYLETTVSCLNRERVALLRELAQLQPYQAQLHVEDTASTREQELLEVKQILDSRIEVLMRDNVGLRKKIADGEVEARSRQQQQQRQLSRQSEKIKALEAENYQIRYYNSRYQEDKQALWQQLEAQKAETAKVKALLQEELAAAAASAGAEDTDASTANSHVRALRAQLTLAQQGWERERQKLSQNLHLAMQQLESSRSRNRELEGMLKSNRAQTEDLMTSSGSSSNNGSSSSNDGSVDSDDSSSSSEDSSNNSNGSSDDSQFSSRCCSTASSQSAPEVCENTYPYDVVHRFYHGDGKHVHVTCELDNKEAAPVPSPFMMVQSVGSEGNGKQQESSLCSDEAAGMPRQQHGNKQMQALPGSEAAVSFPAPTADLHQPAPVADAHQPALAADLHQPAPAADAHQPALAADVHQPALAADVHQNTPAATLAAARVPLQQQGEAAWSGSWQD